jgi:hypothetical protein
MKVQAQAGQRQNASDSNMLIIFNNNIILGPNKILLWILTPMRE